MPAHIITRKDPQHINLASAKHTNNNTKAAMETLPQ